MVAGTYGSLGTMIVGRGLMRCGCSITGFTAVVDGCLWKGTGGNSEEKRSE
jgi:hypothetical protein